MNFSFQSPFNKASLYLYLCFSSATFSVVYIFFKKSSFKALLQFIFSYQQLAQLQKKFARSLVICISFKFLFCSWIFTKYLTSFPLCCFTFIQLLMHFCDQTSIKTTNWFNPRVGQFVVIIWHT